MLIIPSILTDNPEEAVKTLNDFNEVILPHGISLNRVQIDINDGTFLGMKSVEPQVFSETKSDLKFDYHLMVSDPAGWVRKCVKADRVIGQIEYMPSQPAFADEISNWRLKGGLAVDFGTDLDLLDLNIIQNLDVILLMSYPAGMGGQEFNEKIYDKIEKLKEIKLKGNCNFKICLDGGITLDNVGRVKSSGVDEVVIGKRVSVGDVEENLEKFYKAMY